MTQPGIPRQIIGDQGSDLRAGIEKLCQHQKETCSIYDMKHKTAAVLQHAGHEDTTWQALTQFAVHSKHQLQPTALAFLAPPHHRTKARSMHVELLVDWGKKPRRVFDQQRRQGAHAVDDALRQEQWGWRGDFREPLHEWGELLEVITVTESCVRTQGVDRGAHRDLKALLASVAHLKRTKKVSRHLVAFVAEESMRARPPERLVGSSEVMESVCGTLQRGEQDQAKAGCTGLVLSVAALVSTTTTAVMQKARETVPTKQVLAWCKETLGPSVQAKSREAFASHDKTEQKRDQFEMAM